MLQNRQKHLIYVLVILVIVLAIAVIALSILYGSQLNFNRLKDENKICTTKPCLLAASKIIENIDSSVDPCEDFYQFSCGNFIASHRIPDDQTRLDIFDSLKTKQAYGLEELLSEPIDEKEIPAIKKSKLLFRSCMNESFIEDHSETILLEFLNNTFNGWPILDSTRNGSNYDVMEILIKLRLFQVEPIVDVNVGFDPKNPRFLVLRAGQPDTVTYGKQFYKEPGVLLVAYKQFIFKVIKYLNSTNSDEEIKQQIEKIISIDKAFSSLGVSEEESRNLTYINTTIKGLSESFPLFDWRKFIIKGMFENIPEVKINENETVLVDDASYFRNATKLFKDLSINNKTDLKNFLIWSFVKDRTITMSKKFKEARLDFDKVYRGTTTAQPRSVMCVYFVLHTMDYAVGRLYVTKFFNSKSRLTAMEMIDYISREFKNRLRTAEWMDDSSKEKALAKADAIESKIGYPDFIFNDTHMNDMYKDYEFSGDDFFLNTLVLINVTVQNDLKTFRKERNRTNWISAPATVNAFYSPEVNQICFPAGILQPPFYYAGSPNYLNYGGIGNVIGHEIIHGFDDRGRLYDKDGIFFPDTSPGLWTKTTIEMYKSRVKCIIDQYNNYTVKRVNKSLNGFQTQGESIADSGGIKQSFYAYQKWVRDNQPEPLLPGLNFTQNQLFFISYGQIWCSKYRDQAIINAISNEAHPISEFRLLGSTSNFIEFGKAFNCKPGTRNNPLKKCDVW